LSDGFAASPHPNPLISLCSEQHVHEPEKYLKPDSATFVRLSNKFGA